MYGTNSCAGQHGNWKFWNHLHVQADSVALHYAGLSEGICEFANVCVKFLVCNFLVHTWLIAFPKEYCLVASGLQMPVQCIVAHVCLSALEELYIALYEVKGPNFVPLLEPCKFLCGFAPKSIWIVDGFVVHLLVLVHALYVSLCDEICVWFVHFITCVSQILTPRV